jgi:hypothetical protein
MAVPQLTLNVPPFKSQHYNGTPRRVKVGTERELLNKNSRSYRVGTGPELDANPIGAALYRLVYFQFTSDNTQP